MKDWTDELLGATLTEAMEAHTADVEPERARQIARTATPDVRRWPVAAAVAAAAAVLLVAVPAYLVKGTTDDPDVQGSPPPSSSPTVTPSPSTSETAEDLARTTAENRRLAEAASEAALASMPLPDGAVRLQGKPSGWPSSGMGLGPADSRLTVEGWWSVPMSSAEAEDFLANHSPRGMRHPDEEPGEGVVYSGGPDDIRWTEYDTVRSENPAAFTGPTLLVQILQIGDHTVLRASTFLSARIAVSSQHRLADEVTAIQIDRVGRDSGDAPNRKNHPLPTVRLSAAEDSSGIAQVVDAFNALYGSPSSAGAPSCPFPGSPAPRWTVTFFTESAARGAGKVVADWYPSCFGQIAVTVDGQELKGTLDPGSWQQLLFDVAEEAG